MLSRVELDRLITRTVRATRPLAPFQRDLVIEALVKSDPELSTIALAVVNLVRSRRFIRRLGPLSRDSVM